MNIREIFSEEQLNSIRNAIADAEKNCSGEIRVHIESVCKGDAVKRASFVFGRLNMHKTAKANGVLIYFAPGNHACALIGDKGIHEKVTQGFWEIVMQEMLGFFRINQYAEGIVHGINRCGEKLSEYFPPSDLDKNELSDEISFEE